MKTCLTIAGSDSSGGAGIQADLKTFAAHGVYGMSVITALTAQNTLGVHAVNVIDADFVGAQIDAVFEDIRPDSVKIGMLANSDIINVVANRLEHYNANNVVLDPVMIATSGDPLLGQNSVRSLIDSLMPHVNIITPNVAELIALCNAQNINVDTKALTKQTLSQLSKLLFESLPNKNDDSKIAVLSKGGHLNNDQASDYLITELGDTWFNNDRIETRNTHGTGCTLSAAIGANLAVNEPIEKACQNAKRYLTNALSKQLNLGKGNGPLNHSN